MFVHIFCHDTSHTAEFIVMKLRAVWYVIEVLAQENTDMDSGIVLVNFMKDLRFGIMITDCMSELSISTRTVGQSR
jgi:hypothetical protein